MKKTALLCVLFLLILTDWAWAESFTGKVFSITDGNTISMVCGNKARQVKMSGVDCPDLDQPYGPEVRDFLVTLIGGTYLCPMGEEKPDHFRMAVGGSTVKRSLPVLFPGVDPCSTLQE